MGAENIPAALNPMMAFKNPQALLNPANGIPPALIKGALDNIKSGAVLGPLAGKPMAGPFGPGTDPIQMLSRGLK